VSVYQKQLATEKQLITALQDEIHTTKEHLLELQHNTEVRHFQCKCNSCSRSFLVQLFLRIVGMHCKLICQRIFRTVGDRKEWRDLNEKTLGADNGR